MKLLLQVASWNPWGVREVTTTSIKIQKHHVAFSLSFSRGCLGEFPGTSARVTRSSRTTRGICLCFLWALSISVFLGNVGTVSRNSPHRLTVPVLLDMFLEGWMICEDYWTTAGSKMILISVCLHFDWGTAGPGSSEFFCKMKRHLMSEEQVSNFSLSYLQVKWSRPTKNCTYFLHKCERSCHYLDVKSLCKGISWAVWENGLLTHTVCQAPAVIGRGDVKR